MTTVIGLSGSLRKGSYNAMLLRAAAEFMPQGATLDIKTIQGIPLMDEDVEAASGIPATAAALKDAIAVADGLLMVTPEYNNSMPGVFKNAIDWLSRPSSDIPRVFRGKPVALISASPSGYGGLLSQNAWLPVFRTLGMRFWSEGRLTVSRAHTMFAADGALKDAQIKEQLKTFVQGFVEFVRSNKR